MADDTTFGDIVISIGDRQSPLYSPQVLANWHRQPVSSPGCHRHFAKNVPSVRFSQVVVERKSSLFYGGVRQARPEFIVDVWVNFLSRKKKILP